MKAKRKQVKRQRPKIVSVRLIRSVDTDPDTSYLGEYASKPTSRFSIDRENVREIDEASGMLEDSIELEWTILRAEDGDMDSVRQLQSWCEDCCKLHQLRKYVEDGTLIIGETRDDCGRHEYRYFNPSFNYVDADDKLKGITPDECRKYVYQDYDRMEQLNRGDWCYYHIASAAEVILTPGSGLQQHQTIRAYLVSGVESDSDDSYFDHLADEALGELRGQLEAIGCSSRAIRDAFREAKADGWKDD